MKMVIILDSIIEFMEMIPKAIMLISFNLIFYALAYVGIDNILHNPNHLFVSWTVLIESLFIGILINLKTIRLLLNWRNEE